MHTQRCTILVADDDELLRADIASFLKPISSDIVFAASAAETWSKAIEAQPNLILLDLRFPDASDLELLRRLKRELPDTEVIMVSGEASNLSLVVAAIKLGAFDYVAKPVVAQELENRARKALALQGTRRIQGRLLKQLEEIQGLDGLIGESSSMKRVRDSIYKLADLDVPVLVNGESGTGKELVARALHYGGRRRASPFAFVNCASIPATLVEAHLFGHRKGSFTGAIDAAKGVVEAAEDGTVFLDEVGDMPLVQQAALLRVLEYKRFTPIGDHKEKETAARFVLATNRDLEVAIREGRFRQDLYYRMKVGHIVVPPLRTRAEDIPLIVDHLARKLCAEMGRAPIRCTPEAIKALQEYDWPGNVRELKNTLECTIMLGEPSQLEITPCDLPTELRLTKDNELSASERHERQKLVQALEQAGGNQTDAAKFLGVHRNTVRARIRYFGLTRIG